MTTQQFPTALLQNLFDAQHSLHQLAAQEFNVVPHVNNIKERQDAIITALNANGDARDMLPEDRGCPCTECITTMSLRTVRLAMMNMVGQVIAQHSTYLPSHIIAKLEELLKYAGRVEAQEVTDLADNIKLVWLEPELD